MAITGVLAQLYYLICVTAVSPCCTSATVCDTVYSYAQYEFDSTNSSTALPNTSSTYSIHPLCLPPGNNMIIFWNTTGGIGINGTGDSSVTTGSSFPFVELNFGPGFTTGELCFYTVSNFGVPSVTNCMTINAPTSTMEPELYNPDIYFSSPDQSIIISMNHHITHSCKFEIIDITGKTHANGVIKAEGTKIEYQVPVINIPDGIYFIRLTTESNIQTQKLLITN